MILRETNFGDTIRLTEKCLSELNGLDLVVVGHWFGSNIAKSVCVLLASNHKFIDSWPLDERVKFPLEHDHFSDHVFHYKYAYYFLPHVFCLKIQEEKVEILPGQICIACNFPAPHAHPNNGKNFICKPCQFLQQLGNEIQI